MNRIWGGDSIRHFPSKKGTSLFFQTDNVIVDSYISEPKDLIEQTNYEDDFSFWEFPKKMNFAPSSPSVNPITTSSLIRGMEILFAPPSLCSTVVVYCSNFYICLERRMSEDRPRLLSIWIMYEMNNIDYYCSVYHGLSWNIRESERETDWFDSHSSTHPRLRNHQSVNNNRTCEK